MIEGEYVKKYIQIDKSENKTQTQTHLSWSPPLQANSHSASVGSLRLAQWQYACASAHDTCRTGWFILDTNTDIIFNMTYTQAYDLKTYHWFIQYSGRCIAIIHCLLMWYCLHIFSLPVLYGWIWSFWMSPVCTFHWWPPRSSSHLLTINKQANCSTASTVYSWL